MGGSEGVSLCCEKRDGNWMGKKGSYCRRGMRDDGHAGYCGCSGRGNPCRRNEECCSRKEARSNGKSLCCAKEKQGMDWVGTTCVVGKRVSDYTGNFCA